MGSLLSVSRREMARPLKNYNVEERAMKVISRDKPSRAPTHPKTQKIMDDIMRDPSKLKSSRVDPKMLQNLSNVYVSSSGVNPEIVRQKLPTDRKPPDEDMYGYEEPKVIPPGKASLRQILEIIANNSRDADERKDVEQIAKEYNLNIVDVMNMVQYCKTLLVYNPPVADKEQKHLLRRLQDGIDNLKK